MTDREKLLAEAVAVGLILGADFEKNISNVNLQKKIEEKKAENEANAKPPVDENNPDKVDTNTLNDGVDNTDNNLQKKIEEVEEAEEVKIKITSIAATYKKEVLSYEEASEETGVPIDAIIANATTGSMINGYRFNIIK